MSSVGAARLILILLQWTVVVVVAAFSVARPGSGSARNMIRSSCNIVATTRSRVRYQSPWFTRRHGDGSSYCQVKPRRPNEEDNDIDDDDDYYYYDRDPNSENGDTYEETNGDGAKDNYYYDSNERQPSEQQQRQPRPRYYGPQGDGRATATTTTDDLGEFDSNSGLGLPSSFGRRDGWRLPDSVSKSLLAGVFVLGVGLGVTVDSQVNTNPKDLASRDAIDLAAPNPTLCAKLGASAMAFDQRVFVSFNPFNVYVTQADVKPACVLYEANVVPVLRARGLINDDEVRQCKMNMNTWAFVGNLEDVPQLSCVYRSRDAQNEFLSNPKIGIGEDYWYADRARSSTPYGSGSSSSSSASSSGSSSGKIVKGALTGGQEELLLKKQQQEGIIK